MTQEQRQALLEAASALRVSASHLNGVFGNTIGGDLENLAQTLEDLANDLS